MSPQSETHLKELFEEIERCLDALRLTSEDDPDRDDVWDAYDAAHTAYDTYAEATRDERIYAPMRARIEAAAVGQPPIVQEAMMTGVSISRYDLTAKEKGQLQRARRSGLLEWELNSMGFPPRVLYCSHSIAFGTTQGGSS